MTSPLAVGEPPSAHDFDLDDRACVALRRVAPRVLGAVDGILEQLYARVAAQPNLS